PAKLIVKSVQPIYPIRPGIRSNATVTIENTGQQKSGQYNITYEIVKGSTPSATGATNRLPLPGGTSRKDVISWVPTEAGSYALNVSVVDLSSGEMNSKIMTIDVSSPPQYGVPEYGTTALVFALVVISLLGYFMQKQSSECKKKPYKTPKG
ncbi:MAG: hypothetical protein J7L23_04165, partial [Candidatus Diapherotrites archaeon]|nr:hypothetical protein [Candidatus Diapherotrites archaeon]